MSNVVLLVQAIAKEAAIEAFKEEVLSTAAEAVKEPFCISIDLYQDPYCPHHFTLYEVWGSKDYLTIHIKTHLNAPHILSFFERTEKMLVQPFEYNILTIVSQKQGSAGGCR